MPTLKNYHEFEGAHWETASIRHALAYQGITMPHNGKPLSEAMLLGISGGVVIGYFSFAYTGYDPHVALLTRNTFDPMDHIFERLGIVQTIKQTTNAEKGVKNLIEAIEEGHAPLVWADIYSLAYNGMPRDDGMWMMMPLIVYGYDGKTACLADRARVPLEIPADALNAARTRTKDNKSKLMTLDLPDLDKLPRAIEKGIHACLSLYTETPPKGSKNNFGFAALNRWVDLLLKDKDKQSWAKVFPQGPTMFAGLTSAFWSIEVFGTGGGASRGTYADFLDEASEILGKTALKEAAALFRACVPAWHDLGKALLSDDIAPFKETRELTFKKSVLFKERGAAATDDILAINARLMQIKAEVAADFPLDSAGVRALCEQIAAQIMIVHDCEREAVTALESGLV